MTLPNKKARAVELLVRANEAADDYKIRSGAFTFSSAGVIEIPRLFWHRSENLIASLDVNSLLLPATPFLRKGCSIADRPDLCSAIIRSLDALILAGRESKARHVTGFHLVRTLAKIFEHGWLHGIYSLKDWTPAAFDRLARQLTAGGWYEALQLESRCDEMLKSFSDDERVNLWAIQRYWKNDKVIVNLSRKVMPLLGTNARHWEVLRLRRYLASICSDISPEIGRLASEKISFGEIGSRQCLQQFMQSANHLVIPKIGLSFVPFPVPAASLRTYGWEKKGRTRSIGPAELAIILSRAQWWIYSVGPILIAALERLMRQRDVFGGDQRRVSRCIIESPEIAKLEAMLGQKIRTATGAGVRDGVPLKAVTEAYLLAAMTLVAALNARRRNEVVHPLLGLQTFSLKTVNDQLGIYLCDFYIEKSVRRRLPFYVGRTTKDVITALGQLSEISRRIVGEGAEISSPAAQSLFSIPVISAKNGREFHWLGSNASIRVNNHVLEPVGGGRITAHMFRRAYALLFHYRYEHGTLQALCQQLGHQTIEMTRTYITDTPAIAIDSTGAALYARTTDQERRALDVEKNLLDQEINNVAKEKLYEFIACVVRREDDTSGGYGRLVQRFHQALCGTLSYCQQSLQDQAKRLSEALFHRGHLPLPMRHGTCMAGGITQRSQGHCHSEVTGVLEKSNASAEVCGRCPYHLVTAQHVENLKQELQEMEQLLQSTDTLTLQRRALGHSANALRSMIGHHIKRLEAAYGDFNDRTAT
ncbi:hypothetical protein J2W25_001587 [Variovorax boronicumulans]|uniref:Tyr recombinase domain-containing protein n=1 Tax=Variovorax boronicumulans TaxID=436515 RepID=A0AAW8DTD8_9BURK|nr:hypothetical protein [Variovorax boronicumulans]MDP9876551.1 hypothetical protein [Variovorax boronicumulans]MDP9922572.1 hypothetical protein [Variovorax boronicumulans]